MSYQPPKSHKELRQEKKNGKQQANISGNTSEASFSLPSSTFNSPKGSPVRTYAELAGSNPPAKHNQNSGPNDMEQDFAFAQDISQNFPQKTGYAKSSQHPSKIQAAAQQIPQPNTTVNSGNQHTNTTSGNSNQQCDVTPTIIANKEQQQQTAIIPADQNHQPNPHIIIDDVDPNDDVFVNEQIDYETYDSAVFKAATPMSDILREKEFKKQLINRINAYCTVLANGSFIKSTIIGQHPNKRLVTSFSNKQACDDFYASLHESLAIKKKDVPTFHSYDPRAIMLDHNQRTVLVTDIPLDAKELSVISCFQHHGNVSKCVLRTNMRRGAFFQKAYVTFDDDQAPKKFENKWCTYMQGACLRVYPATFTSEEQNSRSQFSAVLTGLPPGIKCIDLASIYSNIGAASMSMPMHKRSYKNKPWVYFFFRKEEVLQAAIERDISFSFNNNTYPLKWINPTHFNKLCVRCDTTTQTAKECTTFKSRGCQSVSKNVFNIYNRFKPSGFDKFKQSHNNNNKRTRSSSRSRSRSRGPNKNLNQENTVSNNNTTPSSTQHQKSISYADAANSSLNASIHSPANSNYNNHQRPTNQISRPQFSNQERMQLKFVSESLGNIAKELNTLQSEYNSMASRFNKIEARLDALESNNSSSPTNTQNKRREPGRIHPPPKSNNNQTNFTGTPIQPVQQQSSTPSTSSFTSSTAAPHNYNVSAPSFVPTQPQSQAVSQEEFTAMGSRINSLNATISQLASTLQSVIGGSQC
jgi:hypothetical protein